MLGDETFRLRQSATKVQDYIENAAWEQALKQANHTQNLMVNLAEALVQKAYDEGMTKKDIATALGIPARTLRGMEKST